MIELFPQSDNDQFISTIDAELYFIKPSEIPKCQNCKTEVAYHEWEKNRVEFACHGNILRFHFVDGLLARVEELAE
ncbi:hypothetical protein ND856_18735 [Leptospira bandrabouensis]|uniref:hypothetical protein n=1 Tax=Leptospira bandrabouensis TaxID=2484903 RepID=UPI00223D4969|nr:hypothetical protein [Leptospira bandrabouensis]MCW7460140.1 hypothetical protein [Leptospira bandrabouensis]MCW7479343.1 hypothetical protein [Leptospira bandrabouensis]MCW7487025.1 hypothetical protein [Leptospira bandrabouensis]